MGIRGASLGSGFKVGCGRDAGHFGRKFVYMEKSPTLPMKLLGTQNPAQGGPPVAVPHAPKSGPAGELPPLGGAARKRLGRERVERARAAPERRVAPDRCPVPGTDFLTGIAARRPAAAGQGAGHLGGGLGLGLDGVGGEAAGRIQTKGVQRPGGAGLQAGCAGAAMLVEQWLIGLQLHGQQQHAQETPGASLSGDQQGVLALPTQAGPGRQLALQEGRRIHADAAFQIGPADLGGFQQPVQAWLEEQLFTNTVVGI